VISRLWFLSNLNLLSLTERRALSVNILMRFEQNRETPEEDQLVGASEKISLRTSQRATALQASRSHTVLGLMYARHERDALAVLSAMSTRIRSCGSPLV
jgi:hypothetical protein